MGLSDCERYRYAFNAIFAMAKLEVEDQRVSALIDQLFPALLGGQCNGGHWIMGSASSEEIIKEINSPWAVAICNAVDEAAGWPGTTSDVLWDDEMGITKDDSEQAKYFEVNHFSPVNLLSRVPSADWQCDKFDENLVKAYKIVESYIYAANRYPDDELAEKLKPVTTLMVKIQGYAAGLMSESRTVGCCWLASRMMDMLFNPNRVYGPEETWDPVVCLVINRFMQQYISPHTWDYHKARDLKSRLHSILQECGDNKESMQEIAGQYRMELLLSFTDDKFAEHDFQNNRSVEIIEECNQHNPEYQHIDIDWFAETLEKSNEACRETKRKEKERFHAEFENEHRFCWALC